MSETPKLRLRDDATLWREVEMAADDALCHAPEMPTVGEVVRLLRAIHALLEDPETGDTLAEIVGHAAMDLKHWGAEFPPETATYKQILWHAAVLRALTPGEDA